MITTNWRNIALGMALVWMAVAALLHPTLVSMIEIWERSET